MTAVNLIGRARSNMQIALDGKLPKQVMPRAEFLCLAQSDLVLRGYMQHYGKLPGNSLDDAKKELQNYAASLLGWDSYDDLYKAQKAAERDSINIQCGLWAGRCSLQEERYTVIAGNIRIVLDEKTGKLVCLTLNRLSSEPEKTVRFTGYNGTLHRVEYRFTAGLSVKSVKCHKVGNFVAAATFHVQCPNGAEGYITFARTEDGIMIQSYDAAVCKSAEHAGLANLCDAKILFDDSQYIFLEESRKKINVLDPRYISKKGKAYRFMSLHTDLNGGTYWGPLRCAPIKGVSDCYFADKASAKSALKRVPTGLREMIESELSSGKAALVRVKHKAVDAREFPPCLLVFA